MVGFKELLRRLQIQEQMTKQHQTRVDVSTVPARLQSPNVKKDSWAQCLVITQEEILKQIMWCQGQ